MRELDYTSELSADSALTEEERTIDQVLDSTDAVYAYCPNEYAERVATVLAEAGLCAIINNYHVNLAGKKTILHFKQA